MTPEQALALIIPEQALALIIFPEDRGAYQWIRTLSCAARELDSRARVKP